MAICERLRAGDTFFKDLRDGPVGIEAAGMAFYVDATQDDHLGMVITADAGRPWSRVVNRMPSIAAAMNSGNIELPPFGTVTIGDLHEGLEASGDHGLRYVSPRNGTRRELGPDDGIDVTHLTVLQWLLKIKSNEPHRIFDARLVAPQFVQITNHGPYGETSVVYGPRTVHALMGTAAIHTL